MYVSVCVCVCVSLSLLLAFCCPCVCRAFVLSCVGYFGGLAFRKCVVHLLLTPTLRVFHCGQVFGCRRNIKTSPWKLNLVAKQIRGLSVDDAIAQMTFSKKDVASHIRQVRILTTPLCHLAACTLVYAPPRVCVYAHHLTSACGFFAGVIAR